MAASLGVKELYEKHHHVVLPDDVLKAAVDYSIQYIPQRTLPDKAIDLIDMTESPCQSRIFQNSIAIFILSRSPDYTQLAT